MRLIDAEELVKICRKGWRLFGFSGEKICHWVDEYDINAQPTIKAIPAEWIRNNWLKRNDYQGTIDFYPQPTFEDVMNWLIEDWEKENAID